MALPGVLLAIDAGQVLHHPLDRVLTEDVLRTVSVMTDTGQKLSGRRAGGPIEGMRALCWAVRELSTPGPVKPVIHVGRR